VERVAAVAKVPCGITISFRWWLRVFKRSWDTLANVSRDGKKPDIAAANRS
jgi:hypothetical protein